MLDLLATRPIRTVFWAYRRGGTAILRVTLYPRPDRPYRAEAAFRSTVGEESDAFRRLLEQDTLDLHVVDDDLCHPGTQQYTGGPLRGYRPALVDFGRRW